MYGRSNIWDELKTYFKSRALLPRLIIINIAVWLVVKVILVFAFLLNFDGMAANDLIVSLLGLPASFDSLITRPWTPFTYMFLHFNLFHILFNMLWLYWFGRIFMNFLNEKQLLSTYLIGGLAGGALYILAYNVFPVFSESLNYSVALGASAAVMAIVTTISFYVPNYTIVLFLFGKVKIVYIAIVLFVLDFFMINSGNAGGHLAHIGGAIYGFIYAFFLLKGKDISSGFGFGALRRFFMKPHGKHGKRQATAHERPLSDEEYNKQRTENENDIDSILEKIKRSGYESLSKAEKEFLFKSSNKHGSSN